MAFATAGRQGAEGGSSGQEVGQPGLGHPAPKCVAPVRL